MVSGAMRPTEQISVGTREQLSTLYRLSLAEYLGSTIVLDDQLVQSDDNRMDWFRALLAEKARNFQILVFTCRPGASLDLKWKTSRATNPQARQSPVRLSAGRTAFKGVEGRDARSGHVEIEMGDRESIFIRVCRSPISIR